MLGVGEGATFPVATRAMQSLDAAGSPRVRAGHHARVRAARQRDHAADRRVADRRRRRGADRSSCSDASAWCGWSSGSGISATSRRTTRAITPAELERAAEPRPAPRRRRRPRRAVAAARAPHAAGHGRLFLLRLDAVAVPQLAAVVLPARVQAATSAARRCSRRRCSSRASAATTSAA